MPDLERTSTGARRANPRSSWGRIRYVIYTTADFDRAGGAAPFNGTAELVAAEGVNQRIGERRATLPSRFAALDRNASGALESGEIDASAAAEAGVTPKRHFLLH